MVDRVRTVDRRSRVDRARAAGRDGRDRRRRHRVHPTRRRSAVAPRAARHVVCRDADRSGRAPPDLTVAGSRIMSVRRAIARRRCIRAAHPRGVRPGCAASSASRSAGSRARLPVRAAARPRVVPTPVPRRSPTTARNSSPSASTRATPMIRPHSTAASRNPSPPREGVDQGGERLGVGRCRGSEEAVLGAQVVEEAIELAVSDG